MFNFNNLFSADHNLVCPFNPFFNFNYLTNKKKFIKKADTAGAGSELLSDVWEFLNLFGRDNSLFGWLGSSGGQPQVPYMQPPTGLGWGFTHGMGYQGAAESATGIPTPIEPFLKPPEPGPGGAGGQGQVRPEFREGQAVAEGPSASDQRRREITGRINIEFHNQHGIRSPDYMAHMVAYQPLDTVTGNTGAVPETLHPEGMHGDIYLEYLGPYLSAIAASPFHQLSKPLASRISGKIYDSRSRFGFEGFYAHNVFLDQEYRLSVLMVRDGFKVEPLQVLVNRTGRYWDENKQKFDFRLLNFSDNPLLTSTSEREQKTEAIKSLGRLVGLNPAVSGVDLSSEAGREQFIAEIETKITEDIRLKLGQSQNLPPQALLAHIIDKANEKSTGQGKRPNQAAANKTLRDVAKVLQGLYIADAKDKGRESRMTYDDWLRVSEHLLKMTEERKVLAQNLQASSLDVLDPKFSSETLKDIIIKADQQASRNVAERLSRQAVGATIQTGKAYIFNLVNPFVWMTAYHEGVNDFIHHALRFEFSKALKSLFWGEAGKAILWEAGKFTLAEGIHYLMGYLSGNRLTNFFNKSLLGRWSLGWEGVMGRWAAKGGIHRILAPVTEMAVSINPILPLVRPSLLVAFGAVDLAFEFGKTASKQGFGAFKHKGYTFLYPGQIDTWAGLLSGDQATQDQAANQLVIGGLVNYTLFAFSMYDPKLLLAFPSVTRSVLTDLSMTSILLAEDAYGISPEKGLFGQSARQQLIAQRNLKQYLEGEPFSAFSRLVNAPLFLNLSKGPIATYASLNAQAIAGRLDQIRRSADEATLVPAITAAILPIDPFSIAMIYTAMTKHENIQKELHYLANQLRLAGPLAREIVNAQRLERATKIAYNDLAVQLRLPFGNIDRINIIGQTRDFFPQEGDLRNNVLTQLYHYHHIGSVLSSPTIGLLLNEYRNNRVNSSVRTALTSNQARLRPNGLFYRDKELVWGAAGDNTRQISWEDDNKMVQASIAIAEKISELATIANSKSSVRSNDPNVLLSLKRLQSALLHLEIYEMDGNTPKVDETTGRLVLSEKGRKLLKFLSSSYQQDGKQDRALSNLLTTPLISSKGPSTIFETHKEIIKNLEGLDKLHQLVSEKHKDFLRRNFNVSLDGYLDGENGQLNSVLFGVTTASHLRQNILLQLGALRWQFEGRNITLDNIDKLHVNEQRQLATNLARLHLYEQFLGLRTDETGNITIRSNRELQDKVQTAYRSMQLSSLANTILKTLADNRQNAVATLQNWLKENDLYTNNIELQNLNLEEIERAAVNFLTAQAVYHQASLMTDLYNHLGDNGFDKAMKQLIANQHIDQIFTLKLFRNRIRNLPEENRDKQSQQAIIGILDKILNNINNKLTENERRVLAAHQQFLLKADSLYQRLTQGGAVDRNKLDEELQEILKNTLVNNNTDIHTYGKLILEGKLSERLQTLLFDKTNGVLANAAKEQYDGIQKEFINKILFNNDNQLKEAARKYAVAFITNPSQAILSGSFDSLFNIYTLYESLSPEERIASMRHLRHLTFGHTDWNLEDQSKAKNLLDQQRKLFTDYIKNEIINLAQTKPEQNLPLQLLRRNFVNNISFTLPGKDNPIAKVNVEIRTQSGIVQVTMNREEVNLLGQRLRSLREGFQERDVADNESFLFAFDRANRRTAITDTLQKFLNQRRLLEATAQPSPPSDMDMRTPIDNIVDIMNRDFHYRLDHGLKLLYGIDLKDAKENTANFNELVKRIEADPAKFEFARLGAIAFTLNNLIDISHDTAFNLAKEQFETAFNTYFYGPIRGSHLYENVKKLQATLLPIILSKQTDLNAARYLVSLHMLDLYNDLIKTGNYVDQNVINLVEDLAISTIIQGEKYTLSLIDNLYKSLPQYSGAKNLNQATLYTAINLFYGYRQSYNNGQSTFYHEQIDHLQRLGVSFNSILAVSSPELLNERRKVLSRLLELDYNLNQIHGDSSLLEQFLTGLTQNEQREIIGSIREAYEIINSGDIKGNNRRLNGIRNQLWEKVGGINRSILNSQESLDVRAHTSLFLLGIEELIGIAQDFAAAQ